VEDSLQNGLRISAGEHPLTLRQFLPATGRTRASNLLAGRLLPTVTLAAIGPVTQDPDGFIAATVTINGFLLGRNEDAILIGLYRDGAVAHLFDIVKPLPGPGDPSDNQQQLVLGIPFTARVEPGNYQLIVLVNAQQARQSPTVALVPP
jgi:hypothetical protein